MFFKSQTFRNLYHFVLENSKLDHFQYIQKYGNYHVKNGLKFLLKNRSDLNDNRIFDYVHGTHCLNSNPHPRTMARTVSPQRSPLDQGAS
jgi:hypothetical protein